MILAAFDLAAVRVPHGDQLVLPLAVSAVVAVWRNPVLQGGRNGQFGRTGQGGEQQPEPAEVDGLPDQRVRDWGGKTGTISAGRCQTPLPPAMPRGAVN